MNTCSWQANNPEGIILVLYIIFYLYCFDILYCEMHVYT